MKIGPKHIMTGGSALPQGVKAPALTKMFEQKAPIPMTGRSLAGRVQRPKATTERGKALSKEVGKTLKGIPTPYIKKTSSSSGS